MSIIPAVSLERVSKCYGTGAVAVSALTDVSLDVPPGDFLSIMGPSGSGKSTLLNLIAGLDTPTSGRVIVLGQELGSLASNARSRLRLRQIGIVFQSFNLFPTFTAEENVSWPLEFMGVGRRAAAERATAALARVRLQGQVRERRPGELSGGEQQRVAIARALVTEPRLLLADEPTGNLDSQTGKTILDLLCELNEDRGLTVVLVTHSEVAAGHGRRIVEVGDGRIQAERRPGHGTHPRAAAPRE